MNEERKRANYSTKENVLRQVVRPRPRGQVAEGRISKEWATCQACPRGRGRTTWRNTFS